jgi:CHASE3 domain sensor protein
MPLSMKVPMIAVTLKAKQPSGRDPIIAISLAGALIFFIVSGAVAFANLQTLRRDNLKLVHSGDVLVALGGLLSSMQDAETGQRGFLLTNNETYLQPYDRAIVAVPERLDALFALTSDNPAQQANIAALKPCISAKLAELKATIGVDKTQGPQAALAIVNSNRGKADMDAVRARIAAMVQVEDDLRAARRAEMTQAYDTASASGLLSGLLSDPAGGARAAPGTMAANRQGRAGIGDAGRPDQRGAGRERAAVPRPISGRRRGRDLRAERRSIQPCIQIRRARGRDPAGFFHRR